MAIRIKTAHDPDGILPSRSSVTLDVTTPTAAPDLAVFVEALKRRTTHTVDRIPSDVAAWCRNILSASAPETTYPAEAWYARRILDALTEARTAATGTDETWRRLTIGLAMHAGYLYAEAQVRHHWPVVQTAIRAKAGHRRGADAAATEKRRILAEQMTRITARRAANKRLTWTAATRLDLADNDPEWNNRTREEQIRTIENLIRSLQKFRKVQTKTRP